VFDLNATTRARGLPASRRQRLLGLVGTVIGLLLLWPAPAASAHAFLTGSTPADGETLATAPSEIRMTFSESVALEATVIDIVDSKGRHFQPTDIRLAERVGDEEGAAAAPVNTEEPAEVVAALPALPDDAYRISWHTLSSDDLHTTDGVLVFGIGRSVAAAGDAEPTPGIAEPLLRAAVFVSLAGALGGLLANQLFRRRAADRLAVSSSRVAGWGAVLGVAAAAVLLTVQVVGSGISLREVWASGYGEHFVLRELGFGLLAIAALAARRSNISPGLRLFLTGVGAAGVAIDTALMGHSGAGSVVSSTRIIADSAHILAAATWAGTLFVAVTVALPAARRIGGVAVRDMLRAFAGPAALCVAVMVVTGVYLTSGVVGSVDALLLTFYGRTLLVKLAVVGVIGVLGIVNTRLLRRPGLAPIPYNTVSLEAGAALIVLLLAAVLTSSQPATEPAYLDAVDGPVVSVRDGGVADLQETVTARPNTPGRNVIVVSVADTRRPAPAPIQAVLISVSGPVTQRREPIAATRLPGGQWSVTIDLAPTTAFTIVVTVERPGLTDVTANYPWQLASPDAAAARPVVSRAPLGEPLRRVAATLVAAAALAAPLWVRRRPRRRVAPPQPTESGTAAIRPEMADAGLSE
jgi:copper transport protein